MHTQAPRTQRQISHWTTCRYDCTRTFDFDKKVWAMRADDALVVSSCVYYTRVTYTHTRVRARAHTHTHMHTHTHLHTHRVDAQT